MLLKTNLIKLIIKTKLVLTKKNNDKKNKSFDNKLIKRTKSLVLY